MRDLAGFGRWIERKWRAHATADVLSRLDRRMMDDIGISPATIAETAEIAARATEIKAKPVQGPRGCEPWRD